MSHIIWKYRKVFNFSRPTGIHDFLNETKSCETIIICLFSVFNADCRIVHFIFHLKSKISFDKMDLIDETGRLVGLHQLEQNKPFARLIQFIKTNVSPLYHKMLSSLAKKVKVFVLNRFDPWIPVYETNSSQMTLFSVFIYLSSNVKMSGVFSLQHLLISLPKLPTEFVILK